MPPARQKLISLFFLRCLNLELHLSESVVVRVRRRSPVIQKLLPTHLRRDRLKLQWYLVEVEAVGEIVGVGIGVAERRQAEGFFDEPEDATEIVRSVGNVGRLGVGRDDDKRHTESVHI